MVAVLLGVFFAGENISAWQIGGLLVILLSVLLVNMVKYRKARQVDDEVQEDSNERIAQKKAGVRIAGNTSLPLEAER